MDLIAVATRANTHMCGMVWFPARNRDQIEVGDRVDVPHKGLGTVRYVGPHVSIKGTQLEEQEFNSHTGNVQRQYNYARQEPTVVSIFNADMEVRL